jgi:hypothetical protein
VTHAQDHHASTNDSEVDAPVLFRSARLTLYRIPSGQATRYQEVSRSEAIGYMFRASEEDQVLVKGTGDGYYLVPAADARAFVLSADEALQVGEMGEKLRQELETADTQGQVVSALTNNAASNLFQVKGGLLPNLALLCQPPKNFRQFIPR